ncbi:MAG TPA: hypothetical protein VEP90_22455 [Methylomirabilota bacterium]|nr:hypothetical protein [Methylomirabilota bacterium]
MNFWKGLAKDIVQFDEFTWKIWDITQVYHDDDVQSRVYAMREEWEPLKMVAKAAPCYLRVEQGDQGTMFTLVANEEDALTSVQSFIQNICEPVEPDSLSKFFQQHRVLVVQAIKVYEDIDGYQSVQIFDQPKELNPLTNLGPSTKLLSLSAIVDIKAPSLRVHTLHVNIMAKQIGFSVDTYPQEESHWIRSLFMLVDRAFRGNSLSIE